MANIAALAVKIVANISDLTKGIQDTIKSIDNIAKATEKATPAMKNLEDAAQGLEMMLDAVEKGSVRVSEAFGNSDFGQDEIDQALEAYDKLQDTTKKVYDANVRGAEAAAVAMSKMKPGLQSLEAGMSALNTAMQVREMKGLAEVGADLSKMDGAIGKVKNSIEELAMRTANGILDMKPTMENVYQAQKEVEKLKALAEEMRAKTGDANALADAIEQAEQNVAQMATDAVELKIGMDSLSGAMFAIQTLPFAVLSGVFTNLIGGMKTFGTEFNQRFNGIPGTILKITAVLTALIVVIGLAFAKMTALGVSTTYFTTLLKSSLIYQGFAGFVALIPIASAGIWSAATATAGWLIAQLGLNTAWTYFLASTGIGLILVAIGGIVYGIIKLVEWLTSGKSAAEQMKDEIKAMEDQTAAFRDRIGESIDRYRELNNLARKYHEDNLTDLQKYENKLKEIDAVMNRQNVANSAMGQLDVKQNELQTALDKAKSAGETERMESLQKQIDDIVADKAALQKEIDQSPAMSATDAASAKEKERIALLQGRFGDLLEQTFTPQQEYAKTIFDLAVLTQKGLITEAEQQLITANALKKRNEAIINSLGINDLIKTPQTAQDIYNNNIANLQTALQSGAITQEQYNTGMANALQRFNETDTATLEAKKKADELTASQQKLIDKFKGMETLSPVAAFESLSAELQSVRDKLKPEEFATAQQKLLDDLAKGLGIADFVSPKQSETMESVQQKILDYYNKLDGLGKATFDLAAAQRRVTESFEKQSEYYNLYQKAQNTLIPAQQKLTDAFKRIEEEAGKWGWADDLVAKMKEMTKEEIMGKDDQDNGKNTPLKTDHSQNAALELGTVAYYEAQKKGNDPILKENQKQTKTLETIARNTAGNTDSNKIQFVMV